MRFILSTRRVLATIHRLVGEAVGGLVVLAQGMANVDVLDLRRQVLRLVMELAQLGVPDFVNTFHLANHQFGIADDSEVLNVVCNGVTQRREQSVVLGEIVRVMAEVLAQFGDLLAMRVVNDDTEAGRAGIASGSAVDVGGVGGGCVHALSLKEELSVVSSVLSKYKGRKFLQMNTPSEGKCRFLPPVGMTRGMELRKWSVAFSEN